MGDWDRADAHYPGHRNSPHSHFIPVAACMIPVRIADSGQGLTGMPEDIDNQVHVWYDKIR